MGSLICPPALAHTVLSVAAYFPLPRSNHRASDLAAVKATRYAGGLQPTLTAAAGRASAIASAPGEMSLLSHQGKAPFRQSAALPI